VLALDSTALDRSAGRVLQAGAAGGVAGGLGKLLARLGGALSAEGVKVADVLSIFRGETAVAIAPPGRSQSRPSLVVVARTANESQATAALGALELPLSQLFTPPANGPGQAPTFSDRVVDGITAHQLVLTPGLELDYAVFNRLVVVATSLDGIAGVAKHARRLVDSSAYRTTLGDRPDMVTSLLFLDFSQLLSLGEQTGVTGSASFKALRADLQRIRAVGLTSTSGEADSTAELFLQIP
jgi:hypothetical protein